MSRTKRYGDDAVLGATTSLAEMRRLTDGLVATAVAAAGTKK